MSAGFWSAYQATLTTQAANRAADEARRQAEEAKRAADAAITNNANNQAALLTIQRAFLGASELQVEPVANEAPGTVDITPLIKNSGPTPAIDVSIAFIGPRDQWVVDMDSRFGLAHARQIRPDQFNGIASKVGAPSDPDDIFSNETLGTMTVRHVLINAGSPINYSQLTNRIGPNDGIDAQAGKIGRFISGSIRYTDVFNIQHVSKYCFRIDGIAFNNGVTTNQQSFCRHWNCIDDFCKMDKEQYLKDVNDAIAYIQTSEEKMRQTQERMHQMQKPQAPVAPTSQPAQ